MSETLRSRDFRIEQCKTELADARALNKSRRCGGGFNYFTVESPEIKISSVVSFPFGFTTTKQKVNLRLSCQNELMFHIGCRSSRVERAWLRRNKCRDEPCVALGV